MDTRDLSDDIPSPPSAVEVAAKACGSQLALAQALEMSPQAISKWKRTRIPAERVLDVERVSGISRHLLRPDLYPCNEHAAKPVRRRSQNLRRAANG